MSITYERYFDKVYGGWTGKCLGGAAGAPVEGKKELISCEDYKKMLRTDLPNDDLDLQLLWLEVLQEKGFGLRAEDLACAWEKKCWYPFNEYGIFLKNYERGILPPYSGMFNNPLFCEGEGSPIRSEIWGMSFPGCPQIAASYAKIDSSLDHCGESVWIEQFYAAMEADAFIEDNIIVLIHRNLHYLPDASRARKCVDEVMAYYLSGNRDWIKARTRMLRRYGHHEFTNAVTNLGIVIIALLYGNNNLDEIINIAFRCGYDTDCTCATAAAVYGIILGYHAIDEDLKAIAGDTFVVGIDIESKNRSVKELARLTCEIGCNAEKIGGILIADIPENVIIKKMSGKNDDVEIKVLYYSQPAIGYMDCCKIGIEVKNNTDYVLEMPVSIEKLPKGWKLDLKMDTVFLKGQETVVVPLHIETNSRVLSVDNTNKLMMRVGDWQKEFGIAGASLWKVIGPFTEALQKEERPGIPSAHGEGCVLPTLECMVNNAVFLDRLYVDEEHFEEVFSEDFFILNAYEDVLDLDHAFTYRGQGCVYLEQTLFSPEEREAWIVIGNNDGFKIWVNGEMALERDEIRLWTPYNNYEIIKLRKGKNRIVLKLLRRTESLKFSFGIRKYEGEHFHRKRWYVDFVSMLQIE